MEAVPSDRFAKNGRGRPDTTVAKSRVHAWLYNAAVIISAPSSTANIGPGFDALGIALSVTMDVEIGAETLSSVDETHSAMKAFRAGGGVGPLGAVTKIPPGKGMGYSGAGKVAGFAAAAVQAGRSLDEARDDIFARAAEAEGHPDNAAPSAYGGLTITAAGRVLCLPIPLELQVLVWVPDRETSTDASRGTLPTTVTHEDAAFNVGMAAMLVGAFATGDLDAISAACHDRLHQPYRLLDVPETAAAIDTVLAAGAVAAWLSGSGPTMACLVEPHNAHRIAESLPTVDAHTKVLDIAPGLQMVDPAY